MDSNLKLFTDALRMIGEKDLAAALELVLPYIKEHPYVQYTEEVDSVDENFRLMVHYMEQGVDDPMREKMYADMLARLKKAVRNIRNDYRRRNIDFYKDANSHVGAGMPMSEKGIRIKLEDFVADVAMLQLEDETTRKEKAKQLYSEHYKFIQSLFCSIVVADLWTEEQAANMQQILLSPTVDTMDVLMIVSAIMLATMNNFDINKFNVLVDIYRNAIDGRVRQKALIGWVFSMTSSTDTEEQKLRIASICKNKDTVRELFDFQKQVLFCMNAEQDTATIERDIMPTLIKNSNLNISRFGITEKEDDPMTDILDPGAQDRAMEETEEKFRSIMDMQKAGADVYFGGFSQMKKFPFFWQISNWFTPFYFDHPDLVKVISPDNRGFINAMAKKLPFCDSDKYSFCLALEMMAAKLPSALKEMLSSHPNATGRSNEEYSTPAYIRRKYIQDLYRFFKLNNKGNEFGCPLDIGEEGGKDSRVIFFANPWISQLMPEERADAVQFFFRKRQFSIVVALVEECQKNGKVLERELLALANSYMRLRVYDKAMLAFQQLYSEQKGGQNVMKGLADSMFMLRMFKEAAEIYAKLMLMDGRNTAYVMYHSLSLINSGEAQKGLEDLFRLDYQHPDNPNLKRALAWGYLMDSKPAEAERIYDRLMGEESIIDSDLLNGAYAKWMQSKNNEAVQLLARYSEDGAHDLADDFEADRSLLDLYNIGDYERTIMIDVVERVKQS